MQDHNRAHDDDARDRDPARVAEPVSSDPAERELEEVRGTLDQAAEPGLAKGADEDEQRFDAG